jgi:hypothetical protein
MRISENASARIALWLSVGVLMLCPLGVATLPIPAVPGGWCSAAGRQGHYAVETVALLLAWLDWAAAACVVLAAGRVGRSWAWSAAAVAPAGGVALGTALLYADRINCGF